MLTNTVPGQSRTKLDVASGVGRIGLRNPPLNVIDVPMMEELAGVLAEVESNPDVAIVILSGEGKCFSVGVDVAAHTPDKIEGMLVKFHAVLPAPWSQAGRSRLRLSTGTALAGGPNSRWSVTWSAALPRRSGDFRKSSWGATLRWLLPPLLP